MTWLSCVSEYYKDELKVWCKTAVGGEDVYKDFSAQPAWKIYRWTMMTAAFLYEFEGMITEYNNEFANATSPPWMDPEGAFVSRAQFNDFFSNDPFNLDTLTPYTSSSTTWLNIISSGMFYLNRFNDSPEYGTLEDTWIPTSAWNDGASATLDREAGIDYTVNEWEYTYVVARAESIDRYAGEDAPTGPSSYITPGTGVLVLTDESALWYDDPDDMTAEGTIYEWENVGRLTVFYWRQWEYDHSQQGDDSSTRLWSIGDGGLDTGDPGSGAEFVGGGGSALDLDVHGWRHTDVVTMAYAEGAYAAYEWQDQFQFDLGLVQWDPIIEKMKLDDVPLTIDLVGYADFVTAISDDVTT
jgi:hypothetical protein